MSPVDRLLQLATLKTINEKASTASVKHLCLTVSSYIDYYGLDVSVSLNTQLYALRAWFTEDKEPFMETMWTAANVLGSQELLKVINTHCPDPVRNAFATFSEQLNNGALMLTRLNAKQWQFMHSKLQEALNK